jgi:hypothetical protein
MSGDLDPDLRAGLTALSSSKTHAAGAVEGIEAAVLADGAPTAAAAVVGAELVALLKSGRPESAGARVEVLYLLGQLADAALTPVTGEPGAPPRPDGDGAVLACRRLLPDILAAAEHVENDPDEDVRVEAADTAEAAQEALDSLG